MSGGQSGVEQSARPPGKPPHGALSGGNVKIAQQVRDSGVPVPHVQGSALLNESVLVVNQKAKVFGINTEYAIFDQHGRNIGVVREVGQRVLKKAVGAGGQRGSHRFQVLDAHGRVVISLSRPATLGKSRMTVTGANSALGEIVQRNTGVFKKVRFELVSAGKSVGSITADGSHAWDFTIRDANEAEIGRITKTWAGWAKERFTKADNYVVQIHRHLDEPLRSLVVAGAIAIDTALKQGSPTRKSGKKKRKYS